MHTTVLAPFPQPVKDMAALLELMREPEKWATILQPILDAKAAMEKDRAAIGSFEDAASAKVQADAMVAAARAEADALRARAQADTDTLIFSTKAAIGASDARLDRLSAALEAKAEELTAREENATRVEGELVRRTEALDERERRAFAVEAALHDREQAADAREARLKAAFGALKEG